MDKYFKRRFPYYFDDSDYQTNAPSYYDDLARKQKLIEMLAKKIWEYEETLDLTLEQIINRLETYIEQNDHLMNERLEQWDLNLENFPENVELLLQEWLSDGTLDHIINVTLMDGKVEKTDFYNVLYPLDSQGDGTFNDTENIKQWLDSDYENLFITLPDVNYLSDSLLVSDTKKIFGNYSKIIANEDDEKLFNLASMGEKVRNYFVTMLNLEQPIGPTGSGTENNHFPLSFSGGINSAALLNVLKDVDLGISSGYGAIDLLDRTGLHSLIAFNYMENVRKMGIQNIGSSYNRIIGNAIEGEGGSSHGLRISGYGDDGIGTKSEGHVATGNVINGMDNVISFQNTAKFNAIGETSSKDTSHALIQSHRPTNDDNAVEFNSVKGLTFKNTFKGIVNEGAGFNDFEIIGETVHGGLLIEEFPTTINPDDRGHNHYKVIAKDLKKGGVVLRYPHNKIDLDLVDVSDGTGVQLAVGSDNTVGDIKLQRSEYGIAIFSNNNNLRINATNITGNALTLSGNNNTVEIVTDGNVVIAGSNNILNGHVGGEITITEGSGTHEISGVKGYKGRGNQTYKSTNELGEVTFAHGLKTKSLVGNIQTRSATPPCIAKITGITETDVTVTFTNPDGTPLDNETVWFYWQLEAIS